MARFPSKEAEVIELARGLVAGLDANAAIYPAPPVSVADFQASLDTYVDAKNALIAALAAAEEALATKNEALTELIENMKTDLRYAENTVGYDDDKLKRIDWGGRRPKTKLQAPGQVGELIAPRQGEGWVFLSWKAAPDGGKVTAYEVQRRQRPKGKWLVAATALAEETTLVEKPRGPELEYRIVAVNKAGESPASNTTLVVL